MIQVIKNLDLLEKNSMLETVKQEKTNTTKQFY